MSTDLPNPPGAVRWITRTLEDAGYETWAVGGAVRDALRGQPSGDWDLATRARPKTVRSLFRRTVPIGIDHGTVGILARDGTMYEITTFRRDVETDGRHAVVAFADTLDEDLARRDFTINAIAWHPLQEQLRDPFGGREDLQASVLRTVGAAEERFAEDYLRILRAFRFAGRFQLDVEEATWVAACSLVGRLTGLSAERIREELVKILTDDPAPSRALDLYADSGALAVLYPEVDGARARDPEAWAFRLACVDALPAGRADLRLAGLLRGLPAPEVAALLMRLRLSNAMVEEVASLADADPLPAPERPPAEFRRWLSRHGPERLEPVARLDLAAARVGDDGSATTVVASWRAARAIRRASPALAVSDLALDGRGLIGIGLKPGPHFGTILDTLLDWVLEDPSRNETSLLAERAEQIAVGMGLQTAPGAEKGRIDG